MPLILPSGRRPYLPAAARYDGATRDWAIDGNDQYRGTHPNDQGMALSFAMTKGECSAAPDVGNTLIDIPYLYADDLQAQVETHVRNAYPCSRLLSEGKIRIDSIRHEVRGEGGDLAVAVDYTNLDTSQRDKAEWFR